MIVYIHLVIIVEQREAIVLLHTGHCHW